MPLYDAYGREFTAPPRKPDVDMLGIVRIRDQWTTHPSTKLTPEKLGGILREAESGDILRQSELAEEMEEKDLDLASLLQTRKLAVQGLDYEIQPASDSAEDKKIADLVTRNLADLELDEPTLDLLDAIFKGFATVEIRWDLSEGQAWVSGLEWVPQTRWTFTDFSGSYDAPLPRLPRLLTTEEPSRGIEVDPFKVIYHRHKARSGLAQRGGLLRPCSWFYLFKNYAVKDWVIFLEKFGQPMRWGKYTPGASTDDIKILKEAVQNLGVDAAAVTSDTTMIEVLEAKGVTASSDLYAHFGDFANKGFAKAILGQTATTEGTPGKLGGEKSRSEVRHDLVEADAKALSKTLRAQLIWPMVGFNFGWDKLLPTLRYIVEEPEDLHALAATHKLLVDMGAPIPVSFIQEKYGIPAPQGDEPILSPPQVFPLGGAGGPSAFAALKKKVHIPIGGRLVPLSA